MTQTINVVVNGIPYSHDVEDRLLLVQYLRETLGLTGTHSGCVIGECGACSILFDGRVVKSCLMLAVQAGAHEVTTIEGLQTGGELHPLQEAFVATYGAQCGFCTPGMILTALDLLSRIQEPTEEEIRQGLAGNLCMCTGYVQIVQAVQAAAAARRDR